MSALRRLPALIICLCVTAFSGTAESGAAGPFQVVGSLGTFVANRPGEFGTSLSLSGSRIAVGAPFSSGTPPILDVGQVYVHAFENGAWTENSYNIVNVPNQFRQAGMQFGASVAISGNDMIVGAPGEDVNGATNAGAVYFFRRDDIGIWQFRDRNDSSTIQASQRFGASVAITANYAAAGAPSYNQDSQTLNTGRVTLYLRSSEAGSYSQNGGELTPSPQGEENFGSRVHFQDLVVGVDRLFIGAPNRTVNGMTFVGSAYFYERIAGDWQLRQTFAPAIDNADFGGAAIATAGNYLFLGAYGRDAPGGVTGAGSVRVYLLASDGFYDFDDELFAEDAQSSAEFGRVLAASGTRLVVGARTHDFGAGNSGRVFVFDRRTVGPDTLYVPNGALALAGTPAIADLLGSAVALSSTFVFAAAPKREIDVNGTPSVDAGLVQIYDSKLIFADSFE